MGKKKKHWKRFEKEKENLIKSVIEGLCSEEKLILKEKADELKTLEILEIAIKQFQEKVSYFN